MKQTLPSGSNPEIVFDAWRLSGEGEPPPRTAWWLDRTLCFVGAWEPLSFRKRAGYAYTDEDEFYHEEEFSDRAFQRYKEAGANALVIPFAKGFGLRAAVEEIAHEKDIVRRAHRVGLKVGTYIRADSLVPEMVEDECPGVAEWLVQGMYGRTASYGRQQTFRKHICLLHPGAIAWLESLIVFAVRELGADFLHFDGFSTVINPWANCRCPRCVASYRKWLGKTLPALGGQKAVFGLCDLARIEIPDIEPEAPLPAVLSSPDFQMWHRYLWDREAAFARHVRRFTRQLSPDLAMTANPGWYPLHNGPRVSSGPIEHILPWLDAIWLEDGFQEAFHRIRGPAFKRAREYGVPVCHYHWEAHESRIEPSLALSLAANGGNLSCLGFSFRYLPHYSLCLEGKKRFGQWAEVHGRLLRHTVPSGEIALVRHALSMAWNAGRPCFSVMALEQLLFQMHIPWRLFSEIDPNKLRQVRTLILPDAECLSDHEIDVLMEWVREGGRLFFTAGTATHNENRRRRPWNGILARAGESPTSSSPESLAVEWYRRLKSDVTELSSKEVLDTDQQSRLQPFGRGVLGFWPHIDTAHEGSTVSRVCTTDDLLPPINSVEIESFLRRLHGEMEFEVKGPRSLLLESNFQPATGETLLHLIRTDVAEGVIDIEITRSRGWDGHRVFSPDLHPPESRAEGQTLHLSRLQRYALIVVSTYNS